jgi:hypothetical protein
MIAITIPQELWVSSILPEGILEQWLKPDRSRVQKGDAIATVRIEDALHTLMAPATGRLTIVLPANAVVDPGASIGRVES